MTSDCMLSVDDVFSGYGETEVLHGVSLDINEGEIVSLVGRNGAGKTTTLRTIMGRLQPTSGTITYRGEDISTSDATETANQGIGLVPEERRIFPELTVRENLEVAAYGSTDTSESMSVDEALSLFENLSDREENEGSALSGGEQQMLTIARALVNGADLVMLDEPTEGLAPYIVEDVMNTIRELNDRGISILLVEQNVHVCLELADRNYVIDQGEIVWHGQSQELEDNQDIMNKYLSVA